jgi:hypothetical protein
MYRSNANSFSSREHNLPLDFLRSRTRPRNSNSLKDMVFKSPIGDVIFSATNPASFRTPGIYTKSYSDTLIYLFSPPSGLARKGWPLCRQNRAAAAYPEMGVATRLAAKRRLLITILLLDLVAFFLRYKAV